MRKIILALAFALTVFPAASRAQDNPPLDRAAQNAVVEGVAAQIEQNFYDSQIAADIAADLRARLAAGEFRSATNTARLAEQLTGILQPHDTHFSVRYLGVQSADHGPAVMRGADRLAAARRANFGFNEVAILPGNVGYIDMRQFFSAQHAGETALAALNFIAHTDAVIFDMRYNRGGSPSMVQFLASHFLEVGHPVVINTFMASGREYPAEMYSLSYLPGPARPDVPLYILTSARTGSAGEAFPYHMQAMDRATIVGETTYGAGNPGGVFPAGEGFGVFVSTSRTRNPITGANWEGTGVSPDVDVPAADALDAALMLAYDAMLDTAEDLPHRQSVEWAREAAQARLDPFDLDASVMADIAGQYGDRAILMTESGLVYRRGERAAQTLTPLAEDRFLIEGLDGYRLTIQRQDGQPVSLTIQLAGGPASVSMRD